MTDNEQQSLSEHSCHAASRISSLVISPHNNHVSLVLVCGKFLELLAHAQTVDTRPFFSLTTWPVYEARGGGGEGGGGEGGGGGGGEVGWRRRRK